MISLAACASLNKEDCQKMDWSKRGFADAAQGSLSDEFSNYKKQCQEFGVAPSQSNYLIGYREGLKVYCNYQHGYDLGIKGEEIFKGCQGISTVFYRGYEKGFQQFEREQEEVERKIERDLAVKRIIDRYDSQECTFESDCLRDGQCSFGKCSHNQNACHFNSDCKIQGQCRSESEYAPSINEWVQARVCSY